VSVNELSVEKGVVTHAASGKTTSYGIVGKPSIQIDSA